MTRNSDIDAFASGDLGEQPHYAPRTPRDNAMDDPVPCPRCASANKRPIYRFSKPDAEQHQDVWMECSECQFRGGIGATVREARKLWDEYRPETAGTVPGKKVIDLATCPRCGERHEQLQVHELANRHWALSDGWAWCPSLQQPIVFVPQNIGQSPAG